MNVSQQEDPFTVGEDGLQDSCQAPFGLPGWHWVPLPSPPGGADLRKGWSGVPVPSSSPNPESSKVQLWATQRPLPQEIPKGQSKKKSMILPSFPHTVHAEAVWYACSKKSPPAPWTFFLVSSQSHQHCSLSFPLWALNISWTNPQQKKKIWIFYKVDAVPQICIFHCKSIITKDPGAKSVQEMLCSLVLVQGIP